MAKITWKGSTLLAPVPAVMVSCGNMERSNIITVAWTGILSSNPPRTYVSVRPERHSHKLISETGELCINLVPAVLVRETDWCGIRSGRDVDKFEKQKLHKEACANISCPQIAESPLTLECKVFDVLHYGTHDVFVCDIIAVNADESLLDEAGKLHLERAKLCAYCHGEYFALGKSLGKFGFSHAKKKRQTPKKK